MVRSLPHQTGKGKPAKPDGFPLTPHPGGRWCKKIGGKLYYFGHWSDPKGALAEYLAAKDAILAGQWTPPAKTHRSRKAKPKKPYADFPLTPHPTGRWCKRILGRLHYFGPIDDPDGALRRYQEQREDLYAGRQPRPQEEGLTLKAACNAFLAAKGHRVESGELTYRQWHEYFKTFEILLSRFGKTRLVSDLRPEDFAELRAFLARGHGVEYVSRRVQCVRSLLKWLWENDYIEKPVKVGTEFRRPSATVRRKARLSGPRRIFSAAEIRILLELATPPMKAMILLGANCGFGNTDCAALPLDALDLDKAIVEFPRPKTGIERRAMLWPETVAALKTAIERRPKPKNAADGNLVFITKYGGPWVRYAGERGPGPRGVNINAISLEFTKLLKRAGIRRPGVGFYALRHTFRTVADETGDQPAVNRIMGHQDGSMAAIYRQWLRDERENARLKRVADYVRNWLFEDKSKTL